MADNALGRTKKYIEISGRPGPAEFISPMFSGSLEYYNLTWSVESIPPLEEIRLLYRRLMVSDQVIIIKRSHLFHWHVCVCVCFSAFLLAHVQMNETYQHPGKWQDILLIPTLIRSSGNHYIMSHVIRGLDQNSVYEAIVQAKNRYGWNEVMYTFNRFYLSTWNLFLSMRVIDNEKWK